MSKSIRVDEDRFIDRDGRQVILHGVNMVCKDKNRQYIGDWGAKDFKNLKRWGLNVIRLGVIWDGLEPKPGVYNDAYIEELKRLIQEANEYDIYVLLDMHQDLYSSLFADGAPSWATFTDGEVYEAGHVWSDAYLFNGAVQKAFDHFWRNTPAPDGVGIQDHFVQAWRYLVKKLHKEPNIIGYDLMNEPFIGSEVLQVNEQIFAKYADVYSRRYDEVDPDQLLAAWNDPQEKQSYLRLLEHLDAFKEVADAPSVVTQPFEQHTLSPFYQKVADGIRASDPNGILFLETNYFSNLGTESMIQPITNDKGEKDGYQAYAPHAYDIVTDTELAHTANDQRLSFIFDRHEQTRQRLNMPMLIGEWGAFYESDKCGHVSMFIQRKMEQWLCSDTYWSYTPQMDDNASFLGVCRGYPMAVSGHLLQYRYEHHLVSFQMKWDESKEINAPTVIYHPDIRGITSDHITLDPAGSPHQIHPIEHTNAGYIEIPPTTNGTRTLTITGRQK